MFKRSLLIVLLLVCGTLSVIARSEATKQSTLPKDSSNWIATPSSRARNDISLKTFSKITILNQGRLKPLDSYARNLLLRFSGKSSYKKKPAISWLAEALYDSEKTFDYKIFLINNPEVLEAISVEPDLHRTYSFSQLQLGMSKLQEYAAKAVAKPEKERSEIEKEFLRVFMNLHCYINLIENFQFYSSHPDFSVKNPQTLEVLELQTNENSLFDILSRSKLLEKNIQSNQEAFVLSYSLFTWIESHKTYKDFMPAEEPLAIIPLEGNPNDWLSPWDALLSTENKYSSELYTLRNIFIAYQNHDQKTFDENISNLNKIIDSKITKKPHIGLELFYNQINPFLWAKILYGLVFLLSLVTLSKSSAVIARSEATKQSLGAKWIATPITWARNDGIKTLLLTGLALHLFGIISRIIILSRPPVTNLYETFIFVSLIMVILGMLINRLDKSYSLGDLLAAFSGLVLLLIAGKFAAEGDTMQVLIAVLNSNFWLSTHVICVSIGYAGVALAGLLGHLYLLQVLFKSEEKLLAKTQGLILGVLGFGLCFSFLGTMLGGIWADQSWGRFWGWDPKENGALIIVLWCAMLFHARLSGIVKSIGLATGAALGTVVVITSWFGINLLGVGLHSYGFTSGLATGLYTYYAIEFIFLILAVTLINWQKIREKES